MLRIVAMEIKTAEKLLRLFLEIIKYWRAFYYQ